MREQLNMPGQTAGGFARALRHHAALALRRNQRQHAVGLAKIGAADDHGFGSVDSISHCFRQGDKETGRQGDNGF